MNKKIDFTRLGGYPLAQEDLDFLQISYREAFIALAGMIGDKVIIKGMVEGGGDVTAGWISLNNEMLPFIAGTIGTGEYIIEETTSNLTFQDGVSKDVLITRVARFSAGGPYQYSDLQRLGTLKNIWKTGDVKQVVCDAAYIAANFDGSGLGINERVGWARMNGNNGTIDMGGFFPVGQKDADADYDLVGDTGGEKTHTLITNELPVVNLSAGGVKGVKYTGTDTGTSFDNSGGEINNRVGFDIPTFGGGLAHENRPPFKSLLFIQKL